MSSTGSAMVWGGKTEEGGRGERRKGERERRRRRGKGVVRDSSTLYHHSRAQSRTCVP